MPRAHCRLIQVLYLYLLCCCINNGQSLKCRTQDGNSDAELKRIVRSCMHRIGSGSGSGGDHDTNTFGGYNNNDECVGTARCQHNNAQRIRGNDYYGTEDGNQRRNRHDFGQQQPYEEYGYRMQRSAKQFDAANNRNNASEAGQCVAHCFFSEMNMIDGNGMPDRRKISYMLTKDVRERDLRSFYMDTVQQCFRYLDNYHHQKCRQARELIRCMSENAKAQCDDWEEYSNILFN